jgi:FAD-linked oxidoreductase
MLAGHWSLTDPVTDGGTMDSRQQISGVPDGTLGPGGHWRNWVGNQSCIARHRNAPRSEDELASLVAQATRHGLNTRVAGSGHSFTPIVATGGLLLSLQHLQGILAVDRERKLVTVAAGSRIGDVGRALKALGLSLKNQGDIDSQALAGALSTGTHGTGKTLGNMSSQAVGMRLVQPDGSILEADDAGILHAAQVSLGVLGVISALTLKVTDAYNLQETIWRADFAECLEAHDELAANNRHFAFFWCPVQGSRQLYCLPDTAAAPRTRTQKTSDVCEMKIMNVTDAPPSTAAHGFEKVAYSSEIYPIEYVPNFHELEYAIPAADGPAALCEVRDLMLQKHTDCIYPVEYRFTAGDPAWISPFHERDSVTISVSGGPGMDYWAYLGDVDAILRRYAARPHWGKLHFTHADDLDQLLPNINRFRALRRRLDPEGRFLNDHLRQLFA